MPPLEKIPEINWTHNDGLHSHCIIWKEQWQTIFKSDYLFASDQVKVHKLYRHIRDEGQKKLKQWNLNLDEITPDQLFEHGWMKSANLEVVHTDQDQTCGTTP